MPKVFVVILNYNGEAYLEKCLKSVYHSNYPNFEVVVVDNAAPNDQSLARTRQLFPRIHFIQNTENIGFARGNNLGIRFALEKMADYVFLLNNDALITPQTLSTLVAEAEKTPGTSLLSPLIYVRDTSEIWFSGATLDWLRMRTSYSRNIPANKSPYPSQLLSGCALLIPKKVFEKIGLLDENLFLYYGDTDFTWRAQQAGFANIVVPQATAFHWEQSNQTGSHKSYWLTYSALYFFQKNSPFYARVWQAFLIPLRKLKNRKDLREKNNSLAIVIKKAYDDFAKK